MIYTDWFPPRMKPVRPGVYLTAFNAHVRANNLLPATYFRYYDGQNWFGGGNTPATAMTNYEHRFFGPPDVHWLGLVYPAHLLADMAMEDVTT